MKSVYTRSPIPTEIHSTQSALPSTGGKSKFDAFSLNYSPLKFYVHDFKLILYI